MGFFDFLFSHKNKEERLEERRLERQEEAKKQEEARRKVLEEEGVLLSSLTEEEDLEGPREEVADLEENLLLAEEKQGQEADLIKEEKVQEVEEAKEEGAQETEPIKEEETKVIEETPQEEIKAPIQEDLVDRPQDPIDFRNLTLLKLGESLDLPSTSKIQKLKVTKVADEFYDLSFESNGFTYERKRIHQDILKNHLENYQKTGSMVLKSFRQ